MKQAEGFTIIEVIVTVVLVGMFIMFFVQMFRTGANQQQTAFNGSLANDIAKTNLNKYSYRSTFATYTCSGANDLKTNPEASGTNLLNDSSVNKELLPESLPNLTQSVAAFSPYGCTSDIIKVVSKVTYGPTSNRQTVQYATYAR